MLARAVFSEGDAARPITASQPPERARRLASITGQGGEAALLWCVHSQIAIVRRSLADVRVAPKSDGIADRRGKAQYSSNICWISSGLLVFVNASCSRMRAFCGLRLSAATNPGSCQLSSRTIPAGADAA